jgi:hypothetical protein
VLPRRTRTGPPDFVGVGAQRSGTTWWYRLLLDHPRIELPLARESKEFHFFDKYCTRPMGDEEVARYHRWFERRRRTLCGEWTPRYMYDAWTPPLLRRAAPEARLLVLLRDPIERYRSGVAHHVTRTPWRRPAVMAQDSAGRGMYATQLRRLYEHFPREQVLVLQYERCRAQPLEQYDRTLRFLGLEPGHVPDAIRALTGPSHEQSKEPLWPEMQASLLELYAPEVDALEDLAEDFDRSQWEHFA